MGVFVNQNAGMCQRRGWSVLSWPWLRRLDGVLVLTTMLTGCTVGPDFQTPSAPDVTGYLPHMGSSRSAIGGPVPGAAFVHGAYISDRWWELLHSRHLNELIRSALIQNADLQAAEAAVRIAQANALAQRGSLFPLATANFGSSRQQTPSQTLQTNAASGASIYSLHTAQVNVAYVADVFGGVRRQIETTDALVDVQVFQREGVYLTLTANIALAAIQEASLRGQLAATRRLIEIQMQLLGTLRRQYDSGQIALPDVVGQETAVAQARLLLPPLERALGQQRDLLAFLAGRFPSEDVAATFELRSFNLPRKLPLSVPADLVRQRPDVRVAEANLHAANAQIGVAIANRLPQITLTGTAGSTSLNLAKLFTPGTGFWMIAGGAAQTVFDAGTLAHKQTAAEQAQVQVAAQYRGTVLQAFQNVADVLRALASDERAVSAAIEAERSASRNIELVRAQVERGQVSIAVLLNAQQAYLQTSLARVQAQAARLADTVALFQALGGGWWNRPKQQVVARGVTLQ
jgi:NodT family efflux transporter outer membrane factor (OMF) lipoprotein